MLTSQGRVFMGVDRRIPPPRPTRLQLIKLLTTGLGFGHIDFPIATMARKLIGKPYSREARMSDAPNAFTCSTLVKYLYAMRGIWIPRFVEQQYEFGRPVENLHAGDLVFRSATRIT
ncbi:MAG: NLP/P60 protein [Candidatus Uhrbacteria bacterium GW2011_GWD2_52_7]|uniref:NLP/P60 protein n=1 Tax=Candidatus Uhrbacteria bacterium GW2011_GWD2_52_7 TaxID=1618989 RepID=A0A0G1ZNA8_9BACT|nr:MAG: NLP/P60 protein [Candidatus Uhrbacteria bacterium GW2011_GWD2_52_7]